MDLDTESGHGNRVSVHQQIARVSLQPAVFRRERAISLPAIDREPSQAHSLPGGGKSPYRPSLDASPSVPNLPSLYRRGVGGQGMSSWSCEADAVRKRDKMAAKRALALDTPTASKRGPQQLRQTVPSNFQPPSVKPTIAIAHPRHGATLPKKAAEKRVEIDERPASHQRNNLTSANSGKKLRIALKKHVPGKSLKAIMGFTKGRPLTRMDERDLIDPVSHLIEDVIPKDMDDQRYDGGRTKERLINLPIIVCYGSDDVIIMNTEKLAHTLRKQKLNADLNKPSSKNVSSPAEVEKLPIPSHWPGEPDWIKAREPKKSLSINTRMSPVPTPNSESPEGSVTSTPLSGGVCAGQTPYHKSHRARSALRGSGNSKASLTRTHTKSPKFADKPTVTEFTSQKQATMARVIAGMQAADQLNLSAAAKRRHKLVERWKTPKNLVPQIMFADVSDDDEDEDDDGRGDGSGGADTLDGAQEGALAGSILAEMSSIDAVASSKLLSRKKISKRLAKLSSRPSSAKHGAMVAIGEGEVEEEEEEDVEARQSRWAEELELFQQVEEEFELRDHQDYNFTGPFGKPTENYVEQQRFVKHVMKYNPVAFDVEAADVQEEEFRAEVRKAKLTATSVMRRPGKMNKLHPKFMKQVKELKSTRPALVWPDMHRIKAETRVERRVDRQGKPKPWDVAHSIFVTRFAGFGTSGPPSTAVALEATLMFDWGQQRPTLYSFFCKGRPVSDRNDPAWKERLDEVAADIAPLYARLTQAFYHWCLADDATTDNKACLLSFRAFQKPCDAVGITDIMLARIEEKKESGDMPELLRRKNKVTSRPVSGATSEHSHVTNASKSQTGESELDGFQIAPEMELEWLNMERARFFRPEVFKKSEDGDKRTEKIIQTNPSTKRLLSLIDGDYTALVNPFKLAPINRAEWLETATLMAIEKYMRNGPQVASPVEALQKFVETDLAVLEGEVKIDIGHVRDQFYDVTVEKILRRHNELLKTMFKVYKARDKTVNMGMRHWLDCLNALRLLDTRFGLDTATARSIFAYSIFAASVPTVDNLNEPTMTIFDFLEGLARVANALSFPTKEQLQMGYKLEPIDRDPDHRFDMVDFLNNASDRALQRRIDNSKGAKHLSEKLERLMEYLVGALCRYWGHKECNEEELVRHMDAVAQTVWKWGGKAQASFRTSKSLVKFT